MADGGLATPTTVVPSIDHLLTGLGSTSQLPPLSAARSMTTDPGAIARTISVVHEDRRLCARVPRPW